MLGKLDLFGNVENDVEQIGIFGYFNSNIVLSESMSGISAGDLDSDGLDEIIFLSDYAIDVKNENGTSCDNFPVEISAENTVLIANIIDINQNQVELIFRENNSIIILSNSGEIIERIASESNQPLRLVPWGEKIALIDGRRLILFEYDDQRTFWTSTFGTDWNYPMPSLNSYHEQNELVYDGKLEYFYNYPNPVRNGNTNFRFFFKDSSMNPMIKIYSVEGTLLEVVVPLSFNFSPNEFNEIEVNFDKYHTGVYFAEILNEEKSLGFTKVAIIR